MLKIKKLLFANKITVVCLLILMLASFAFASVLFSGKKASDCIWYQGRTYYSDATHTTVVGGETWFCDGSHGRGGTITAYFVDSYCDCIIEP